MKRVAKSIATVGVLCGFLTLLHYWLAGNALALAGGVLLAATSPLWLIWIFADEFRWLAGKDGNTVPDEWCELRAHIKPTARVTEIVVQTVAGLWVGVMAETPWLVLAGYWVIRYCLIGMGGGAPVPKKSTVPLLLLSILGCAIGEWTRR
jgi:hypothetical protein